MYSKYHAKKTECRHGHLHDSKKEAQRCNELHLQQCGKQIKDLQTQVRFELLPSLKRHGKTIERKVDYIADFVYIRNGHKVVEDVKGMRTDAYKLKRKMFRHRYPDIEFIET